MPARSPEFEPDPTPSNVGIFAGSDDMATEIGEIADGDVLGLEELRELDPDQVEGARAGKRLGWVFWLASGVFGLVVALALLAPILPLDDPTKSVARPRLSPSPAHWFGTDTLGRDILSRVIWGARVSLVVGIASILMGLLIGGTVGIVAGYFRGRWETWLMGAMDVLLSFPALLLALAIITFADNRSLTTIVLAIGIVAIAPVARLVRANTLVYSQREFVTAARSLGASNWRILVREVLPNVILPVISFAIILMAVAIVAEGGLAFLGLSVEPPTPTWGAMINDGRAVLADYPFISLIPCAVMFVTVLALNLAGDRLREYFDIKEGAL